MSTASFLADNAGEVRRFRTSDGQLLSNRHWRPTGEPRACVIALHGVQSHSGWYGYSSRAMAESGIDVRFLDRRGSGLNDRNRGHATSAHRLIEDVAEFARDIVANRPAREASVPIYLLGLSWGARLAASVCAQHPDLFDGLILLYPGLCTQLQPTRLQHGLLRLVRRLGGGRRRVSIPLDPGQFTTDPNWQSFIANDPLAVRQVSVSFLLESERLMHTAVGGLEQFTFPRLVMLAGEDEIVDRAQTDRLLSRLPSARLRIIEYPQARHTLEFEPCRERFVRDLVNWIESMLPT